MRIRTAAAAVTGALALSAFAVPAAHADTDSPATVKSAAVNGGKAIVLDASSTKTFKATVTASDDSGIELAGVAYLHNSAGDEIATTSDDPSCVVVSSTTSTCTVTFKVKAVDDIKDNALAGTWYAAVAVIPNDYNEDTGDGVVFKDKAAKTKVQRKSKLATANATPEPVKKGKTLTVTGKLTFANWASGGSTGYANRSVKLQFRKKGTSTYTTLKTVTTTSKGALKATTKAKSDGYYRWSYAGTTGTSAVSSATDYVNVK